MKIISFLSLSFVSLVCLMVTIWLFQEGMGNTHDLNSILLSSSPLILLVCIVGIINIFKSNKIIGMIASVIVSAWGGLALYIGIVDMGGGQFPIDIVVQLYLVFIGSVAVLGAISLMEILRLRNHKES